MMEMRADMRRFLDEGMIRDYVSAEELRPYSKEDAGDAQLNKLWATYSYLKDYIHAFPLTKEAIHYSLYYWYVKFKKRYFEVCGYDAGIEQEGFRLLEEMERQMEQRIDWKFIEMIEMETGESL